MAKRGIEAASRFIESQSPHPRLRRPSRTARCLKPPYLFLTGQKGSMNGGTVGLFDEKVNPLTRSSSGVDVDGQVFLGHHTFVADRQI